MICPPVIGGLALFINAFQILVIDAPHIAQGMRRCLTEGIATEEARPHFDPWKTVTLCCKTRDFFFRQARTNGDRFKSFGFA